MENRIELERRGQEKKEIVDLNLDNCRSTSIVGLTDEYCNLQSLSLINVGLTSLKGIPSLPELKKLELSDNRISSGLEYLLKSPGLAYLSLSGNRIKDFDSLEPLAKLLSLKSLDLFNCEVTSEKDYRSKVFDLIPQLKYLDGADREDKEIEESDDEGDDDEEGFDDEDDDDVGIDGTEEEEEDDDEDEDDVVEGNNEIVSLPVSDLPIVNDIDDDEDDEDEDEDEDQVAELNAVEGLNNGEDDVEDDDEDDEDDDDDDEDEDEEESELGLDYLNKDNISDDDEEDEEFAPVDVDDEEDEISEEEEEGDGARGVKRKREGEDDDDGK